MVQTNRYIHEDDYPDYISINSSSSCDATTSKTPMVTFTYQPPKPYLKGNHLAVKISEDEYLKGVDDCRNSMNMMIGRLVLPKGVEPLTVEDIRSKLRAVHPASINWNVSSMGKGFYCFRFNSAEDLSSVLTAGSIFLKPDGVLHLQQWTTDFNPDFMTQAWVRIYGVSLEYWREKTLFEIASAVGTPLEVDIATLNRTHCEFARVLVEIDLSNSVRDEVLVERDGFAFMAYFKFEGLPSFCSYCKTIGHSLGECKHQPVAEMQGQPETIPSQLNPRSSYQNLRQQNQKPKVQEQQPPPVSTNPLAQMNSMGEISNAQLGYNHMTNPLQNIYGPRGLGIGTAMRVIRGAGISGPMGAMGQNQMSLNQTSNTLQLQNGHLLQAQGQTDLSQALISRQLANGSITHDQADSMAAKLRVMQNQANMIAVSQPGITGMTATGQMQGQAYPTPVPQHLAYSTPNAQLPFAHNDFNNTTILVCNLDPNISQEELRLIFLPFGKPVLVMVPPGKGCAYVQFETRASAEEAIQRVHGTMIGQKIVRLMWGRIPGTKQQHQPHNIFWQQQQRLCHQQQQLRQLQQIGSPFQGVVSSPLVGSLSANQSQLPEQMSSQMQQFGPQKIISHTAINPQLISDLTPEVNNVAVNTRVTPASPQLSSQTFDSDSISSFSTE